MFLLPNMWRGNLPLVSLYEDITTNKSNKAAAFAIVAFISIHRRFIVKNTGVGVRIIRGRRHHVVCLDENIHNGVNEENDGRKCFPERRKKRNPGSELRPGNPAIEVRARDFSYVLETRI
jgi:hypothetical protein